jgi:hypothetical protein
MYNSISWNTGPAAERARHNLRLRKKVKSKKPQAASSRRLKKNTILK